jgi:hypothetical protein
MLGQQKQTGERITDGGQFRQVNGRVESFHKHDVFVIARRR